MDPDTVEGFCWEELRQLFPGVAEAVAASQTPAQLARRASHAQGRIGAATLGGTSPLGRVLMMGLRETVRERYEELVAASERDARAV